MLSRKVQLSHARRRAIAGPAAPFVAPLLGAVLLLGLGPAGGAPLPTTPAPPRDAEIAVRHAAQAPLQGVDARKQAERAGIDLGRVIETVRHRVAPAQGRSGPLVADDRLYRAEFDSSGFALRLRARLPQRELAARTKAWRASLPPEPGKPRAYARPSLPADAIPLPAPASLPH